MATTRCATRVASPAAPGCRCWRAILAAASSTARTSCRTSRISIRRTRCGRSTTSCSTTSTTRRARFLEFERWWGGFYLMNEEEIRWIVNNLFIGNKLSQGEARLGPGRYFDLKSIKQPIIVFASMGDNITPPQQAFNWISDIYSSHRGDQGERPDDRRTDPRGHRPPRHLRVGQGREEGAHADHLGAEVHPGAAAGPVRHGDPRDGWRGRQRRIRRDAARAQARGPASGCRSTIASTRSRSRPSRRCRS